MWRRLILTALAVSQFLFHFHLQGGIQSKENDQQEVHVDRHDVVTDRTSIGSPEDAKQVIFYNMFIPATNGPEGIKLAVSIVEEQLKLLGISSLGTRNNGVPIQLYFNSMGKEPDERWLQHECVKNNIKCTRMRHFPEGNEVLTLQDLYSFCKKEDQSRTRVVYMHSKGSFHNTSANVLWRRHLEMAVTSKECLYPPSSGNITCNVCGLQFYPMWTPFFPGNFFTAQCDYVASLLPPLSFESELDRVWKGIRKTHKTRIYPAASYTAGSGRQAAEHWIGSHPNLIPCDMANSVSIPDWIRKRHTEEDFEFQIAPRSDLDGPWFQLKRGALKKVMQNETMRDSEHFLLGGLLKKYELLYNATPPPDSWVWSWFPDGERWREQKYNYLSQAAA